MVVGDGRLAVVGIGFWEWRRLSEKRLARLLESADASLGNRLINAVSLPGNRAPRNRGIAQARGGGIGAESSGEPNSLADYAARRKRVAVFGAAVAVAWAALFWAGGEVMEAVVRRFLDVTAIIRPTAN